MVAVLAATLVFAATVQGLIGLGLAIVSAPVVAIVTPNLVPDLMLWLALLMPMVSLVREHHDIDWHGLAWSLPSRIPGTAVGVVLVAVIPREALGVLVGLVVLASVLATVRALEIPVNVASLSAAGFVSGVTGTTTSIGGPPIAILYQHRPTQQIRSTLALYFFVGAGLSLAGLGLAGELETSAPLLALALVPAMIVGFLLSRVLNKRVARQHIRGAILVVCGLSAVVAIARSLLAM